MEELSAFLFSSYTIHMKKIRVGVVRGGLSSEYDVSLKTGENVLNQLDKDKYVPVDILLSKNGEWIIDGVITDVPSIASHIDIVWNALHGEYGEDGKIQKLLEHFGIPYTGSRSLPSAIGMHKDLAKSRFRDAGIRTPGGDVIERSGNIEDTVFHFLRSRHLPVIVKPVTGGSSVATRIANTYDELISAVREASQHGDILVEEVIAGVEATVCVIDGTGDGEHFALHPIEIIPPIKNGFFDFDAKYGGETQEICPGRFSDEIQSELRNLAVRAHRAIGARHYSRSDFIISEKGIYILEINTLPGFTNESLLPKALTAADVTPSAFLEHIITLSLSGK